MSQPLEKSIPDLMTLKDNIKTEAHRLGFTHIGVAPAIRAPHFEAYIDWIKTGKHADMKYLSREDAVIKRGNPQQILHNCQRIISLAMPYQPPLKKLEETPPGKGRVSSYARTIDYHQVIWEKLSQLEDYIHSETNHIYHSKSYVDTGPVLERDYASLAGLGITGKNSCLIIQGIGSYFFLAEIFTDIVLPIDAPYERDLCGSCRRCIDACPTNCILENRTIDANRCISYLTIENKGEIPDNLKGYIGNWVFGCDVCQIACPHNAQTPDQIITLGNPILSEDIDLIGLFSENETSFDEKYGETPLSRAKRDGLLRNAAVALGNQKYKKALPILKQALNREEDFAVKDACRWAINEIEIDD